MKESEFQRLLDLARKGDADALNQLCDAYDSEMRQFLEGKGQYGRTRRRYGLSDVAQEGWVEILGSIEGFRGSTPEQFKSWLRTIFERRLYKGTVGQTRKRNDVRLEQSGQSHAAAAAPEKQPTPSRLMAQKEDRARLQKLLDTLPEDQQEVLRLYIDEELSHSEICERMGLSSNKAVSKLIARSKQQLAKKRRELGWNS